jgi:hypothetical protein
VNNKFKQAFAWSLFLTSIAVTAVVASYLFFDTKYPTDILYINTHLKALSDGLDFNLEKARGAGYSDEDISEGLAKHNAAEFGYGWLRVRLIIGGLYAVGLMCLIAFFMLRSPGGKEK